MIPDEEHRTAFKELCWGKPADQSPGHFAIALALCQALTEKERREDLFHLLQPALKRRLGCWVRQRPSLAVGQLPLPLSLLVRVVDDNNAKIVALGQARAWHGWGP